MIRHLPALALCALTALPATAEKHSHGDQPYKGMQSREIKSLSPSDIAQLEKGAGWGLALPAELNDKPGPAHLLELKDKLDLTADQITKIKAIHAAMKSDAIAAGKRFIAAERALSQAFATPTLLTPDALQKLLGEAAQARAALRYVHLARHLETPPLLTQHQIMRYNQLRGYAGDPCASVPEGHNAAMWRKHNGCE